MALATTNLSPDDQIRNMLAYNDQIAATEMDMQVSGGSIEENLHAIISQINRLMASDGITAGNDWYQNTIIPSALDTGARRGVNGLNTDLHDIERKRILKRVSAIALDIPLSVSSTGTLTGTANFANAEIVTIDATVYTFSTVVGAAYTVLVGGTLAISIANLAAAINLTGTAGVEYGVGTAVHPTVYSSAITATTLVATAKVQGTGGDSIVTTEGGLNASWGAGTLGGGGGTVIVVVLSNSQLPSSTTAAIGVSTATGLVVQTAVSFGTAGLEEVTGANALQPKNLWELVDSSTGEVLTRTGGVADGAQVYGLAQCESAVDGSTITGQSPDGLQISLVVRDSAGGDLELIDLDDVPAATTIDYAYVRRDAFEDCPEEAWLGGGFVDTGVSTATRQAAYDNGPNVLTVANATLNVGTGRTWVIGDAATNPLLTFTEESAGNTTSMAVGAEVDTYANNAIAVTFDNGIAVDNGSNAIHLGNATSGTDTLQFTAAGTVTTSAGIMTLTNDSANVVVSTTTSGNVLLSSAGSADMQAVGAVTIDSSGGAIGIGTDANTGGINIGTAASARTITMGNATGATSVNLDSGTGAFSFDSTVAGTTGAATAMMTLTTSGTGGDSVGLFVGASSPNGVVTGSLGSLFMDGTAGALWQNVDNGTSWTQFAAAGDTTLEAAWAAATGAGATLASSGFIGSIATGDTYRIQTVTTSNTMLDLAAVDGADVVTLGNAVPGTAVDIDSGTGGTTIDSTGLISIDAGGVGNFTSSGLMSVGTATQGIASNMLLSTGDSTTATNDGPDISVEAGDGATTGDGGGVSITAGDGGTDNAAVGGAIAVTAGSSTAANGAGGSTTVAGGAGSGSAVGGFAAFAGGAGGPTGNGGAVAIDGGAVANGTAGSVLIRGGIATLGNPGDMTIESGSSGDGNSGILTLQVPDATAAGTVAANINILGGAGVTTGSGSTIFVTAGIGGVGSGAAGDLNLSGGAAGNNAASGGGAVNISTGANAAVGGGTAGDLVIKTANNTSADAGDISITTGGAFTTGDGGGLTLQTGQGTATGVGGFIDLIAGGGAGTAGGITLTPGGALLGIETIYLRTPAVGALVSEADPILILQNQGTGTGAGQDIQMFTGESDPDVANVTAHAASLFMRDRADGTNTPELWLNTTLSAIDAQGTDWIRMATTADIAAADTLSEVVTNQAGSAFVSGTFTTSWGIEDGQAVNFTDDGGTILLGISSATDGIVSTVETFDVNASGLISMDSTGGNVNATGLNVNLNSATVVAPGDINLTGGNSTSANTGGEIFLNAGDGEGVGMGGSISGVAGDAGLTGVGGNVIWTAGDGGDTSGNAGFVTITGGAAAGSGTNGGINLATTNAEIDISALGTTGSVDINAAGNVTVDSSLAAIALTALGTVSANSDTAVTLTTNDANDASTLDITLTAASSLAGGAAGASIILTSGDGNAALGHGSVEVTGAQDIDEALVSLTSVLGNSDLYAGRANPNGIVTAAAGSLFFFNDQVNPATGGRLYVQVDANGTSDDGSVWEQIQTGADATATLQGVVQNIGGTPGVMSDNFNWQITEGDALIFETETGTNNLLTLTAENAGNDQVLLGNSDDDTAVAIDSGTGGVSIDSTGAGNFTTVAGDLTLSTGDTGIANNVLINGGDSSTGGSGGGAIIGIGGVAGATGGIGGGVGFTGGQGGDNGGTGGNASLTAGAGGSVTGGGGLVSLTAGAAPTDGVGGIVEIAGGAGATNGAGGTLNQAGGAGAGTGSGGDINLYGGVPGAGGAGADITFSASSSGATSTGGGGSIIGFAKAGGGAGGPGGTVAFTAGNGIFGGTVGGDCLMNGGTGATTGAGGDCSMVAGIGGTTGGTGGGAFVYGGIGGTGDGTGGNTVMQAGLGGGTDGPGGTVYIGAGTGTGTGIDGDINIGTDFAGPAVNTNIKATTQIDITSVGTGPAAIDINSDGGIQINTADAADASANLIQIMAGGSSGGTAAGAPITLASGAGFGTGNGGNVTSLSGAGGATGTGGTNIAAAGSSGTGLTGNGGLVSLVAGDALSTAGIGGGVTIQSGAALHAGGTGNGGLVDIFAGAGGLVSGNGGAVSLTGGAASTSGIGGAVSVTAGAGAGAVNGGAVSATAGNSGTGATGDGGAIVFGGGDAASTNGNGGSITLNPGDHTGTGVHGTVYVSGAFDNDEALISMLATGNSGNSSLYAGATVPTHDAPAGSLFFFNDATTITTGGRLYVQVDADGAFDDGNAWEQVQSGADAADTWANVLALGAVSGGTDPVISPADTLRGEEAAQGGQLSLQGGLSTLGGNDGGNTRIFGGVSGGTDGDAGGRVFIQGGATGAANGDGGAVDIFGGAKAGTGLAGVITLATSSVINLTGSGPGTINAQGAGGVTVNSAAGDTGVSGLNLNLTANGATVPGAITLTGATAAGGSNAGGNILATAGGGNNTGTGGTLTLVGGPSGAGATGNGGAMAFTGGAAASTNGFGGSISIQSGVATGTGLDGEINVGTISTTGVMRLGIDGSGTERATAMSIGSIGTMNLSGQAAVVIGSGSGGAAASDISITAGAGSASAGNDVSITAGAGVGTDQDGGNIALAPGDHTGAGDHGAVVLTGAFDADEIMLGLTGTGGGGNSDLYAGSTAPTHPAAAGSLFFFNDGMTAATGGRLYVQVDADTGGEGSTWEKLESTGTALTRQFFQDTMTADVAPSGTIGDGQVTSGTLPSKPASDFTFNQDAEIYLNGIILYNGTEVSDPGGGDDIFVEPGGPTFRDMDVITIIYYTNSTAG